MGRHSSPGPVLMVRKAMHALNLLEIFSLGKSVDVGMHVHIAHSCGTVNQ